jgi:ribosome-associated protein
MTPRVKKSEVKQQVNDAIAACQEKKAERLSVLQLDKEHGGFTDFFIICSGSNPRQVQAIADAVEEKLERGGMRVTHIEGYKQAEWVLLDYVDFVVHVFSEKAREFYDLERLWKSAKRLEPSELNPSTPKKRVAAKRVAAKRVPAKRAPTKRTTVAAKKAAKKPVKRARKAVASGELRVARSRKKNA